MSNLLSDLQRKNVSFIRVAWVDYGNTVRFRVLPVSHFKNLIMSEDNGKNEHVAGRVKVNGKAGITLPLPALGMVNLTCAKGVSAIGEDIYTFDKSSLRMLNFSPGHAIVYGWFEHKEVPINNISFTSPFCPRGLLKRVMHDAKQTDDVNFLIGFETEVIFLKSTEHIVAVNDYGWSESPAILQGSPEDTVLKEVADALLVAGIELQMYHAEAAPGQYEIVTGPLPPLQACDALVTTREIILNVAAKHGLRATLAPRVFGSSCGTAAHTHISLRSASWPQARKIRPLTDGPETYLTDLESAFLAGLLSHLPAATLFTLPTRASYARMQDGVWSGGTYVAWGRDHKEVPIRLTGRADSAVDDPSHGPRFEIKSVDGTACPYFATASLLVAGMIGVREKAELQAHGLHVKASELTDKQRAEYGVTQRMPLNLDEAREALDRDKKLQDNLGSDVVNMFLAVNKVLDDQLSASTEEEAMIKLVKRY